MEKVNWKDWFFWKQTTWFDFLVVAGLASIGLLAAFFPANTVELFYQTTDSSFVVEPQKSTTLLIIIFGILIYTFGRYSQLLYQLKESKKNGNS